MDSQGRKVIVCDNGTGVSLKNKSRVDPATNLTYYFSLSNADMQEATSQRTFSHQWLADR